MQALTLIRCGPSGWTYPDWNVVVYPQVKPRGFDRLEQLAHYFDLVEINRSPRAELSRLWLKKVSHNPNFCFTALLDSRFTHDRMLNTEAVKSFKAGLWPILTAGKLGCVVMQFPWSFRFTKENRDFVIGLRRKFHEFPLAAELRHSSWTLDEALGTLVDSRVGFCNIDQPQWARATPPGEIVTSSIGYIRLHGRRGTDLSEDHVRSDYLYSPLELAQWQARIERVSTHTSATYVITANHNCGKAVVNALQLKSMLELRRRTVDRSGHPALKIA